MLIAARYAYATQRGDVSTTKKLTDQLLKYVNDPKTSQQDRGMQRWLPPFLIKRGIQRDLALQILTKPLEFDFVPAYEWLVLNPGLQSVQADPAFKNALAKSRQRFEKMIQLIKDARSSGEFPKYLDKSFDSAMENLRKKGAI